MSSQVKIMRPDPQPIHTQIQKPGRCGNRVFFAVEIKAIG